MEPTLRDLLFDAGICIHCGDSWADGVCRCDADLELLDEVDSHGTGCACCLEARDQEVSLAPVRSARPVRPAPFLTASTLRLGHGPRINERASFISCGADF